MRLNMYIRIFRRLLFFIFLLNSLLGFSQKKGIPSANNRDKEIKEIDSVPRNFLEPGFALMDGTNSGYRMNFDSNNDYYGTTFYGCLYDGHADDDSGRWEMHGNIISVNSIKVKEEYKMFSFKNSLYIVPISKVNTFYQDCEKAKMKLKTTKFPWRDDEDDEHHLREELMYKYHFRVEFYNLIPK
jgi:hypothetical protein